MLKLKFCFRYLWVKEQPYPSADAATTGGDLEVSIQVFNGSTGEESLHHQQDAIDKESRSNPIDDVLDYINPTEQKAQKYSQSFAFYF